MKICDVTQFYSPRSGGVKRYLHEKIRFIQSQAEPHEHVLIVPGASGTVTQNERSRIYTIAAPIVSTKSQYRALLNLRAIDEILERERPDIIESADPYQLGWKVAAASKMWRIPAIAFYHSHFPEAYLANAGEAAQKVARKYIAALYNQFETTLVPSASLATTLREWGLRNVRPVDLGVDTTVFHPAADSIGTRQLLGIAPKTKLLLYVGRLAPEKNTRVLTEAFALLNARQPGALHLLAIGDGAQREDLLELQQQCRAVTWLEYCAEPAQLARYYRSADIFVHPGVRETFGLVAVESQACGTPVIGFSGTRLDDVIMHDRREWTTQQNAAALAAAIDAALQRDTRALGAGAARFVAERYAWPRVFERLLCIYREVCADYHRRAA